MTVFIGTHLPLQAQVTPISNDQYNESGTHYNVHYESDKIISSIMLFIVQMMIILVGGIVYYEAKNLIKSSKNKNKK